MDLVSLLITVVVLGLIVWLVIFVMDRLGVGEPWRTVAIVIGALILIIMLLRLVGFDRISL